MVSEILADGKRAGNCCLCKPFESGLGIDFVMSWSLWQLGSILMVYEALDESDFRP